MKYMTQKIKALYKPFILLGVFVAMSLSAHHGRTARAIEIIAFDKAYFVEQVRKGERIVVWFHASWCSTCSIQEDIFNILEKEDIDVEILQVDFDKAYELRRTLQVNTQSVLILFDDGQEIDRLVGVVDQMRIDQIRDWLKNKT